MNTDIDTAIYTVTNACGAASAIKPLVVLDSGLCFPTGISNVKSLTNIQIIPNPNNGFFTISGIIGTTTDGLATIEVTNMIGQSVYKKLIAVHDNKIADDVQLSNTTANGMYLLSIRSGVDVKVFHIVVEQ